MRKAVVLALAAIMVLGVAGAAFADSVTYYDTDGGTQNATNGPTGVTVTATVNPKLRMTIVTPVGDPAQTVAFGSVEPGTTYTKNVSVTVESNKAWTASTTLSGQYALMGLSRAGFPDGGAKGPNSYTDVYTVDVPWTTDPGDYTAAVVYSVTQ